jgi:hypothetical protein
VNGGGIDLADGSESWRYDPALDLGTGRDGIGADVRSKMVAVLVEHLNCAGSWVRAYASPKW